MGDRNSASKFSDLAEAASDLKRYEEAQKLAMQAITADPDFGDGYASLGRACLGLQQFDEAERQFRHALTFDAENQWYLRGFGIALQLLGRKEEALESMTSLLRIVPEDALAHFCMANLQADMGQLKDAVSSYKKSLELDPHSAKTHYRLGNAYLKLEKNEMAESQFREALKISPNYGEALNNLGVSLENQKKIKDAAIAYKAAVLADPNLEYAKQNTKKAVNQYLSVGGVTLVMIYVIGKILFHVFDGVTQNRGGDPQTKFVIACIGSGLAISVMGYMLYRRHSRKKELHSEDPQLMEIYRAILKDKTVD